MTRIRLSDDGQSNTVLEFLQAQGHNIPALCGGKGRCGKCRVCFEEGAPEPTEAEVLFFRKEELEAGYRLACCCDLIPGAVICIEEAQEESIRTAVSFQKGAESMTEEAAAESEQDAIVVDIGTTTIAAARTAYGTGTILRSAVTVNHQRRFGADVITRIDAANRGHGEDLKRSIEEDLARLVSQLQADGESLPIVIAGNTTMEHLLQGLSCETLGAAPYNPVDISLHMYRNMTILPGISTFVGADIVSGLLACGVDRSEEVCLLVDLGTNGEIALGNQDRILTASTAAGPALEGGNISCGAAGIPGAIAGIEIDGPKASPRLITIENEPPIGICGSGVLAVVYELLANGLIDETGRLNPSYEEAGYPLAGAIRFTAKDIREVQLAKAAIRAGVEVLLVRYGITAKDVGTVFLAGGFGEKIDLSKAIGIGLLPSCMKEKIRAVGNSSLAGAAMAASGKAQIARFVRIAETAEEIPLAADALFAEAYMEAMYFEQESNE